MAGKAQRKKPTRSRPASPAHKRYPETRLEQVVLIGVGGVLLVAAVVVLVGLFITQYLPPRAHVLTVEDHDYTAAEVKRRGAYMLLFEQSFAQGVTQDNLIDRTIERITRDEVLRRRAPALVGDITADDIEQELRVGLGFATPTPTVAPSPTPGATGTPAATPTAAATPTEVITPDAKQRQREEEDFARAQRDLYRSAGMGRDEFNAILTAQLLERRLGDKFEADLSKTAPQVRLQMIRVADEATAQRVRDQALQGSDFVRLAAQYSITATAKQDGGELGWQLVETLQTQVRDAIGSLPPGGVSVIVRNDRFFELYKVTEADASRALDAKQIGTLLTQKVDAWFAQETPNVQVVRDVSEGEADWLIDEIVSDAAKRSQNTPAATVTGTPSGQ